MKTFIQVMIEMAVEHETDSDEDIWAAIEKVIEPLEKQYGEDCIHVEFTDA